MKSKRNSITQSVEKGDHVYYQHKLHGPLSGEILSHGEHGLTVKNGTKNHQVYWNDILGHKERMDQNYTMIENGEDGSILEDKEGKRRYIEGQMPEAEHYQDKASQYKGAEDGDLVTRRIDTKMQDASGYQVIDGELPAGNILVGIDNPQELIKFLEENNFKPDYDVVSRTIVNGDNESHSALVGFIEEENTQELVNAITSFQRKTALDTDEIIVIGQEVGGMEQSIISHKIISGKTVLIIGEKEGFESMDVSLSGDMVNMMNKSFLDDSIVLFFKAESIKNKAGLSLQSVTDRMGHQTKRWKKTSQDEKDERGSKNGYGTHNVEVDDKISFGSGNHKVTGKVITAGNDGPTVEDEKGQEHQVYWKDITDFKPVDKQDKEKETKLLEHKDHHPGVLGKQEQIPGNDFVALDYFSEHNDDNVTPEDVMRHFPPDTSEKIQKAQDRLKTIEETINIFQEADIYSDERAEIHKEIIKSFLTPEIIAGARPEDGEKPSFMILGGRGGSGKSSFKGMVYDPSKFVVLDADVIKEKLPEYEGWNAFQVHEESGDIFDQITNICEEQGLNLIHDAIMKTGKKAVALVNRFKEKGYATEAHYMHLPRQEAAKRAVSRFLGKSQRYVPVEVVLSNVSNEKSFDDVKELVDKWSFRDNNVEKGSEPILISESGEQNEIRKSIILLGGREFRKTGRHGLQARKKGITIFRKSTAAIESRVVRKSGRGFLVFSKFKTLFGIK